MSQILLSILIPSTPDRRKDLSKLLDCISEQEYTRTVDMFDIGELNCSRYYDLLCPIEILVFEDKKTMTIGEKRELLYKNAKGTHSIQVDSDDLLAPNAIDLILQAIKENPDVDCITFEERCQMNGSLYCANHSLKYDDWEGDGSKLLSDGFHFHRTPFYKNVIKTSISQSVPFEHIRFGEDHAWSIALKPYLKTEVHIPKQLYYYIHEHNQTFEERYGLSF